MLILGKSSGKHDERLAALEIIVFKDQDVSTIIDDLKFRIEEGEATIRKEVAELRDLSENRFGEVKDSLFKTNGRITANEVLKQQFDVFLEKQETYDTLWISYKDEVKAQMNKVKD